MSSTTRITVTLPTEQVEKLRERTDNLSGYVAEAVAQQLRHELIAEDMRKYQEEHGEFTSEELARARSELYGDGDTVAGAA
ncbi:hypothetical protein ACFVMC_06985 [Nocardia sp. NPDC127579]|uniref:hypothetical protein n=1 Tax=Nocardia sp. NPDC127579 TaxID=3345402 RepID=UPI00363BBC9A